MSSRGVKIVYSLPKAVDTLSSRHVSSCDVTRAVGMWEAICHWILWRRFTLLSLCLRHVISRASTPLTFLLSHTFRETWRHYLRVECSSVVVSQLSGEKHTVYIAGYTETGTLSPTTVWRQKLTWDNVTWQYVCVPPHMTWAHVTWG